MEASPSGRDLSSPTLFSEQATERSWNASGSRLSASDRADLYVAEVIFYLVLITMLLAQTALFWWKKKHERSYVLVTTLGLWLVPAVISLHFRFWRFVAVWLLFTATTGYMLRLCSATHLDRATPRRVYAWFLGLFRCSIVMGVSGYVLVVAEVMGVGALLRPVLPPTLAVALLFYGLYFGVLGRDCAEVATDRMAALIGTHRRLAVSVRSCGVCGGDLPPAAIDMQDGALLASGTMALACRHLFHEHCLRGWTIVGKKDTCPMCLEKVDLRSVFASRPWETRNLTWIQMLDAVRYMLVWNPLILLALHFALRIIGLENHAKAAAGAFNKTNGLNMTPDSNISSFV